MFLRAAAYNTVQKRTVLPLQDMKRETMMILMKKTVKLANKDAKTRRNPHSTSEVYLTAVKVVQCSQVATNRKEIIETKEISEKKTATRKVHIQLKKYESFDMCINSMNSLSFSTTDEDNFIQLI